MHAELLRRVDALDGDMAALERRVDQIEQTLVEIEAERLR